MDVQLIPLDHAPQILLKQDITLVGRTHACDVVFQNKTVSKLHCILIKTDGLLLLRDLGSTNGTRVNGKRVRRAALLPNDYLGIAGFRYQVKFGNEPDGIDPSEVPPGLESDSKEDDKQDNDDNPRIAPHEPAVARQNLPDSYS